MNDTQLIQQIGELIDNKLDAKLKPIKEQLGVVETRIENLEEGQRTLEKGQKNLEEGQRTLEMKVEAINAKIDKSQEETIETLTAVIHEGYTIQKRIKRIEDHLNLSQ